MKIPSITSEPERPTHEISPPKWDYSTTTVTENIEHLERDYLLNFIWKTERVLLPGAAEQDFITAGWILW